MIGRVLLVDDDIEVLKINAKFLEKEGYQVEYSSDSKELYKIFSKEVNSELDIYSFDCIVLDVMMPDVDGFTLCSKIREQVQTPIIFLSGKEEEEDRLNGLIVGADDYIIKPYSLRELSARIMVLIRRSKLTKQVSNDSIITIPPLKIDLVAHKAYYYEEEILLSNREYELLYMLASRPDSVITFAEIGEHIWGIYSDSDRKNVMVLASRLRKKIESYAGMENLIENVWSKGYCLKRGV